MVETFLTPLFSRLAARGKDPRAFAAAHGLPADAGGAGTTPVGLRELRALAADAELLLDEPSLGLLLAREAPRGGLGILEYLMRSAPDLGTAFELLVRYAPAVDPTVAYGAAGPHGLRGLCFFMPREPACYGPQVNQFAVARYVVLAREVTGQAWVPDQVWLATPPPDDVRPLHDFFGTSAIEFGRAQNGLWFGEQSARLPIATADPSLLALLEEQVGRLPAPAESLVARVVACIRVCLKEGQPHVDVVAQRLHMSGRTLQRRLAEEGMPYQRLLDDVRRELAVQCLSRGCRLAEVSFRTGYSDLSAFLRAFKRWTRQTPSAFTAQVMGSV